MVKVKASSGGQGCEVSPSRWVGVSPLHQVVWDGEPIWWKENSICLLLFVEHINNVSSLLILHRHLPVVWYCQGSTTAMLCSMAFHPATSRSYSLFRTVQHGLFSRRQGNLTPSLLYECMILTYLCGKIITKAYSANIVLTHNVSGVDNRAECFGLDIVFIVQLINKIWLIFIHQENNGERVIQ